MSHCRQLSYDKGPSIWNRQWASLKVHFGRVVQVPGMVTTIFWMWKMMPCQYRACSCSQPGLFSVFQKLVAFTAPQYMRWILLDSYNFFSCYFPWFVRISCKLARSQQSFTFCFSQLRYEAAKKSTWYLKVRPNYDGFWLYYSRACCFEWTDFVISRPSRKTIKVQNRPRFLISF